MFDGMNTVQLLKIIISKENWKNFAKKIKIIIYEDTFHQDQ